MKILVIKKLFRFSVQAVLKFTKLNTAAQQREAVVQRRSLPLISVSLFNKDKSYQGCLKIHGAEHVSVCSRVNHIVRTGYGIFLILSVVFLAGCTWGGMPPSPDDPDGSQGYGGTANPGYVEPMYPLGDAGIFPKDDSHASNLSTTSKKIDPNEKVNENKEITPIPNIKTKPETKPDSPAETAPANDSNKPDNTIVLFNTDGQDELFVRAANLSETTNNETATSPTSANEKNNNNKSKTNSSMNYAETVLNSEKPNTQSQQRGAIVQGRSLPPIPASVYLIDDLVDQVDEYIKRIGENLEELKTSENYLTDRDSVYRDASGLMLVVLSVGLSGKESRYRAAAPEILVALKRLLAAADHKSATAEFDAVKTALGSVGEPSKLKLEKVVKLKPVMKAMPNLNSNVRRLTNTETKLKRQLDKNPKQIFGQLAALAAISECSIPNADETSKPNELKKWQSECEQFRDAAIKANTAAHDFAKGKIKYESYWSAFSELTRSCDSCHRTFYPDAVGSGN
ncbi:MAG: hypothetical protein LBK06_03935 [Planctomycetaceae bacterium]|jgi:cytochrome c556|nr:hypothetical protein [Planctomycetaceae bacterium]